ncbi:PREDICTED: transcription factor HES-5-like [Nanorana parkeri]|uniref:transcription factor HES-5-like n=1 Tax=Nanorana parkeri TaxID=125878 RepID=UPI000854D12D|nr:PREDICTED: transcription factor HES-5-like [Nanorana parkeri]
MAPCNMRTLDHQATNGLRKLRKPAIEKKRRDRINSSIEQLRLLLEKEFQKHQLPSKPEKADILEMTVNFLQHQMAEKSKYTPSVTATSSQAYRDGYSTCVQDSVTFLSMHKQTDTQLQLLQNLHGARMVSGAPCPSVFPVSQTPSKHSAPDSSKAFWRPW